MVLYAMEAMQFYVQCSSSIVRASNASHAIQISINVLPYSLCLSLCTGPANSIYPYSFCFSRLFIRLSTAFIYSVVVT